MEVLNILEFDKIRSILSKYAASELGVERILSLEPMYDINEINIELEKTDEAVRIIYHQGEMPLGGIYNIKPSLNKALIGSILSIEEILNISSLIYASKTMRTFQRSIQIEVPYFKKYVDELHELRFLEDEIIRCIDEYGKIKDNASLDLKNIRRTIKVKEMDVRRKLQNIISEKKSMLSDTNITLRNNRFVIPVKVEYKNVLKGMIHDESSSGQTCFIEPQEVIEINNQVAELYIKEQKEIERILGYLSSLVANEVNELTLNMNHLIELDFMNAKGKYAIYLKCTKPIMNTNKLIDLKQARHPLIPMGEVVANDIKLGNDYDCIVITGPNTGGKTVTLKVVGLLTLMAQSGLHIPVNNNSKVAIFKNIFADIGDRQSIEHNLSTFSSHMKNIIYIINNLDHESLVLFDELGSGTDPKEGAALAMSILNYAYQKGSEVIATTHYPELKQYSHEKAFCINASVEFNMETLKPTYRLLLGIPGHSNALDISSQLGLNDEIIKEAKAYIESTNDNSASLMAKLEDELMFNRKRNDELERLLNDNQKKAQELEEELKNVEIRKEKYIEQAKKEANKIIEEAQGNVEDYLKELRNSKKEHEIIEKKKQIEQLRHEETKVRLNETQEMELMIGDEVEVMPFEQRGVLTKKISDTEWEVQMGPLSSKVNINNIIFYKRNKNTNKILIPGLKRTSKAVPLELDLRGKRALEAHELLDKYIDDLLLTNYPSATIIHGYGTGAIRDVVRNYLKDHPKIKTYRYGREGEGGLGVTVIEL